MADEPKSPVSTAQQRMVQTALQNPYVQPRNTFTTEELRGIQAEIEDAYTQPFNTFTAGAIPGIRAEREDGFDKPVSHLVKQVELRHSGGDSSLLQVLPSRDVGSVFSAKKWLQIIAEIKNIV